MDPWDQIVLEVDALGNYKAEAVPEAQRKERERCLALVNAELEKGRERGLPDSSAAMLIVRRIASSIESG